MPGAEAPAGTLPAFAVDKMLGRLARCEREVLVGVGADERRRCVHCDDELDPDLLRWVGEAELERVGYAVWLEREHCGRPDCGGGRCGRGEGP